jgi:DNA-binding winged helix-turn-helix (wHTH) protein
MKASQGVRSIRFGPFAIDESAHELRCNGARVPLQEKQFRLLMALLKRPNEVVTRAELHEA